MATAKVISYESSYEELIKDAGKTKIKFETFAHSYQKIETLRLFIYVNHTCWSDLTLTLKHVESSTSGIIVNSSIPVSCEEGYGFNEDSPTVFIDEGAMLNLYEAPGDTKPYQPESLFSKFKDLKADTEWELEMKDEI